MPQKTKQCRGFTVFQCIIIEYVGVYQLHVSLCPLCISDEALCLSSDVVHASGGRACIHCAHMYVAVACVCVVDGVCLL